MFRLAYQRWDSTDRAYVASLEKLETEEQLHARLAELRKEVVDAQHQWNMSWPSPLEGWPFYFQFPSDPFRPPIVQMTVSESET